ncbi:unnamed protein product [Rotaria sp. Silwood1]|nr:unnamed protein product [Rotaria sp. Silwood1]
MIASNKNSIIRLLLQKFHTRPIYRFDDTGFVYYQNDNITKKSNQTILYQQQHQFFDNLVTFHPVNRVNNNTYTNIIDPKFHFFLSIAKKTTTSINHVDHRVFPRVLLLKLLAAALKHNNSSIIKNKIQSFRARSVLEKAIIKGAKQNLQGFTTKATNNNGLQYQQRILDDFYNQQQLRTFDQNTNERNATDIHLNMNSVLKKRKPRTEEDNSSSKIFNNMIFVRDAPVNQENFNQY